MDDLETMVKGIAEGYRLQEKALKKLVKALLYRLELDLRTECESAEMFDILYTYKAELEALIK